MTFERIYELAIEAAIARVNDLSARRKTFASKQVVKTNGNA